MSKFYGIQVAAALAVLVSMSYPTLTIADECGEKVGLCDHGRRADTQKPEFSAPSEPEEGQEGPEASAREGPRTR